MRSCLSLLCPLIVVAACGGHAPAASAPSNVPAAAAASTRSAHAHPPGEPPDFLFLDDLDYSEPGRFSGRPYALSLNVAIPGHDRLRPALAWRLADGGVVDQVAVEGFGQERPTHVEIHVGDHVPVVVVQAILDVYGHQRELPVWVGLSIEDGGFGNRERVYVGSLVEAVPVELTAARLAALLAPNLSADQLHRLLPLIPE